MSRQAPVSGWTAGLRMAQGAPKREDKMTKRLVYPTITIDTENECAEAAFDNPDYPQPFRIRAFAVDPAWLAEDDAPYRVDDDGDGNHHEFATFHEAVEMMLRMVADQMDIDRTDDTEDLIAMEEGR